MIYQCLWSRTEGFSSNVLLGGLPHNLLVLGKLSVFLTLHLVNGMAWTHGLQKRKNGFEKCITVGLGSASEQDTTFNLVQPNSISGQVSEAFFC